MLANIIALELRKHRKSFFSTLFVIVVGVLGTAVFTSYMNRLSPHEAFVGAAAFLICGLPLLTVMFGVQSAVSLRREAERSQEEVIPVSPITRVSGAYLTSLLFFLAVALPILGLLGSAEVYNVVYIWLGSALLYPVLCLVLLIHLHLLGFAISYWLNLPVLGGGLALILIVIDTFEKSVLIAVSRNLWFMGMGVEVPYKFIEIWMPGTTLMAWLLGLTGLMFVATKVERGKRLGYSKGLLVALVLVLGPILSTAIVEVVATRADRLLIPQGLSFWSVYWDYCAQHLPGNF